MLEVAPSAEALHHCRKQLHGVAEAQAGPHRLPSHDLFPHSSFRGRPRAREALTFSSSIDSSEGVGADEQLKKHF